MRDERCRYRYACLEYDFKEKDYESPLAEWAKVREYSNAARLPSMETFLDIFHSCSKCLLGLCSFVCFCCLSAIEFGYRIRRSTEVNTGKRLTAAVV